MRSLLETTAARAIGYLEDLDSRRVAPTAEAIARLERFDEALPDQPDDPETTLQLLDEIGSPATLGLAGARFFGFVIGGSLPAALAANWLVSAWDQNSALYTSYPRHSQVRTNRLAVALGVASLTPHMWRSLCNRGDNG